ncbi:MAG: hypothetical protein V1729_02575 [Candidatus Woesearchaeota archaeon]
MVDKKILVASGLFLIAIMLTGCGFSGGSGEPPVSAQFAATGTEGIVMQFVQDQPPSKVYTGSPVTFLVELRNRGTHDVQSGMFYLTGFDPGIVTGLPPYQGIQGTLEGKSPYNPEGGYSTLEFASSTVTLPAAMPNYNPTFMLTACYPYQTVATPLVCVDSNPLDTSSDKACRAQKVYSTGSQGAPVTIQSIESEARPNGMYFRIHIANTAGGTAQASGTVFDMGSMGSCPGGLSYTDLNLVEYTISISGSILSCDPKSPLRLVNNQGTIFCQYTPGSLPAYQTPLEIRLSYGYKSSISKVVEIENLNFAR